MKNYSIHKIMNFSSSAWFTFWNNFSSSRALLAWILISLPAYAIAQQDNFPAMHFSFCTCNTKFFRFSFSLFHLLDFNFLAFHLLYFSLISRNVKFSLSLWLFCSCLCLRLFCLTFFSPLLSSLAEKFIFILLGNSWTLLFMLISLHINYSWGGLLN